MTSKTSKPRKPSNTGTDRSRRHRATPAACFAALLAAATMLGGCSNRAHTGALIGASVGAGVGYMIGSDYERDGHPHGHGHGHGH